jgi:hypothetical protein
MDTVWSWYPRTDPDGRLLAHRFSRRALWHFCARNKTKGRARLADQKSRIHWDFDPSGSLGVRGVGSSNLPVPTI